MTLCFTTVKVMQTFMYAWYGTAITSEVSVDGFCEQANVL